MEGSTLFEPSASAFVGYCLGFSIRYFAVAGLLYWAFHVAFKQRWLAYRIQPALPSVNDVAHEIRWSMLNMTCTGLTTLVLYALIRNGHTRMYFGIDGAWAYLGLSSLFCFVGYDTWFYWQHRLLHLPWLFRHVHVIHHRAANPTAFASFAHHPIETLLGNAYFILFVVFVPIHPLALAATGAALFAVNMVTHMGYELYPAGFTRHAVLGWNNTSTHHNMHHRHVGCNYSICFNYWDRLMGTNHPAYDDTFDAIKARQEKAIAVVPS